MKRPPVSRLIDLQELLLQFHRIERTIRHPANFNRHETDTEHSYTLAMTAWFLAQYFPQLNQHMVIQLALVHDLLEIYAGDTYVYANNIVLGTKASREAAAVDRLMQEWPDFPDMLSAIKMYETRTTPEAAFVYALDKLMPMFMNYLNHGQTWQYEGITLDRIMAEKEAKIPISPAIYEYYQQLLEILREHPDFFTSNYEPSKP